MGTGERFQFGPFSLDARERVLLRDGRLVPLAPKALSTLLVLVRNRGHVVEKDVLMAEVWPDEVVEEGNLAQHIFTLRKALGENPKYIETIPRRGYRFLDAVSGVKDTSRRYTENAEVYQAYLRGRYYFGTHTRAGLEQAAAYFRQAINLGPNYALAYAGLVDCYLRLATNYLPPAETLLMAEPPLLPPEIDEAWLASHPAIKTGCEWDRKIAEREYQRAVELKADYPAVHQWHAAYLFSRNLYNRSLRQTDPGPGALKDEARTPGSDVELPDQHRFPKPTLAEEVQVCCVIARAQIDVGNYDAASAMLERWWTMGAWPHLENLSASSSADLLFTAGLLAGGVASTRQVPKGQKHAEALLGGAVGLFEQLGSKTLSAEGRIELGICYYREGMFDLARTTLMAALEELSEKDRELRSISLISLASVERHAGRLSNSFAILKQAAEIPELSPWAIGRYHLGQATTYNQTGTDEGIEHFEKALHIFKAIGNHRHTAIAENNYGYLYLKLERLEEVETHLILARNLFEGFGDKVRRAQVDETLAQLYLARRRFELAEEAIKRSVNTLEAGSEEALLAESLTTQGRVLSRLGRQREAKRVLERAYAVAERCGDKEGAGRALLCVIEEMCEQLEDDERLELGKQLDELLADSQEVATHDRLRRCHELIAAAVRV